MKRREFITGAATGLAVGAGALALSACEQKTEEKKPVAAPAVMKQKRELKMVTTWPKNFPGLGTGAQRLADRITAMTGGELTVKLFAAGELVKAFDSFDAVSGGQADMYHGAEYYWQGKSKAFNFFAAVPFGLMANEMSGWIYQAGGQELWDDLSAPFNIKPFIAGNTGVQMGGWFNKEINSVEDYKGLKIRMPGLGGEVLRKLGAAAVSLPGGEIFPSLQSGAIDATEWVGPWNDLAFGFYKVAKFYYSPGFHEPGTVLSAGMNKGVWDSLSTEHKAIVEAAMMAEANNMFAEFNARNGDALRTLIDEHGVVLKSFSDEVMMEVRKASEEVLAEVAAADETTGKVYQSFKAYREKANAWYGIGEGPYGRVRAM
ncbi:TRAP transporter substrate-binding protein [Magnetospira thiophila]